MTDPAPRGGIRAAVERIVPYQPGKPVEEVQRELGLERVVKLASNEGPFGLFPGAAQAVQRALAESNRYPDAGCHRLRVALAERHAVEYSQVVVCAGGDAVIGNLAQALLEPGDEVVMGWPSFVTYLLEAWKAGATPVQVPLRAHRYDLDALLAAITTKTKLVCIASPNNPTGTLSTRAELDGYFAAVPSHVTTILDQAYFEYVDDEQNPDGIAEYLRTGGRVVIVRTFSKIYGLASLRVGYGVAPPDLAEAMLKVRRPFDVSTVAQEAALASLDDTGELERRRTSNREAMTALLAVLRRHGLEPVEPAAANFAFVEVDDAPALADRLLRLGVIVRPAGPFGAPRGLRISAGTLEEIGVLDAALEAALAGDR